MSLGLNYEVRLTPGTSMGWPTKKETWQWLPVPILDHQYGVKNANSTKEGYFIPPLLHLTVLNFTSVLLNWSEPPRSTEIKVKGFRVSYSTESKKVNADVFVGPVTIYNVNTREHLYTGFGKK